MDERSPDGKNFEKKRAFQRRKVTTKVAMLCKGQFSFEKGVEIGEGGMLLRTSKHLTPGDRMELNFQVPGGGFVTGQAEVLYMLEPSPGEFFFGIRFVDPSMILQLEVRNFVNGNG
jgi:hypothetical protein